MNGHAVVRWRTVAVGAALVLAAAGVTAATRPPGPQPWLAVAGIAQDPCQPQRALPVPAQLSGQFEADSSILRTAGGVYAAPGRTVPLTRAESACVAATEQADRNWLRTGLCPRCHRGAAVHGHQGPARAEAGGPARMVPCWPAGAPARPMRMPGRVTPAGSRWPSPTRVIRRWPTRSSSSCSACRPVTGPGPPGTCLMAPVPCAMAGPPSWTRTAGCRGPSGPGPPRSRSDPSASRAASSRGCGRWSPGPPTPPSAR